ncbi:hypothetical protein BDZ90DRAFT_263345 [Jaminaea rosea]|uniref:RINT-1 family protein n=1 Tax=Jaminaea rosea TaxID=1569628 RepID=A0A316UGR0_9BASI|nr:hypothetical protein BDZ90DRAFT_263345 [Jaminaea rosea]PWN24507.1 hypothetical protein BDZ90DRAFT_263345 [Jaminaea rosea]
MSVDVGLSSLVAEPDEASLRRHVTTHPLLTGLLPSSSDLAAQIAALKASHSAAQRRYEKSRQVAHDELEKASTSLSSFRSRLDALPTRIDELDDEGDSIQSSVQRERPGLEAHTSSLRSLQAAEDYYALLSRTETTGKECLASPLSSQALERLAELVNLARYAESLCPSSSSSSSSASLQPRPKLLAFLSTNLDETYEALVVARSTQLREALKDAGWPPLSPEQAEAQGKQPRSPSSLLNDQAAVRTAWDSLLSLQIVGHLLEIKARPSLLLGQGESESDQVKDVPAPGSTTYTPLLGTALLLEPYLLRFRYHFDSDQPTNRLDRPEWYLQHVLQLIRTLSPLYTPQGPARRLCLPALHRYGRALDHESVEPQSEVVHVLLRAVQAKVGSSMPLLLAGSQSQQGVHTSLLGHTLSSLSQFDEDLAELLGPGTSAQKLAKGLLEDGEYFTAWLAAEKRVAEEGLEEILDDPEAWRIGSGEEEEDENDQDENATSAPGISLASARTSALRSTRSSLSLVHLLSTLSARLAPLPLTLSQRLQLLSALHLPLLRSYAQRLTRSLDAFESLSSAFARSLSVPGGGVDASGVALGDSSESMVRGLRGLSRLLKAGLSARGVLGWLERCREESEWLELSDELLRSEEGRRVLKAQSDEAEQRELDGESLGALIRKSLGSRGAARGGAAAGGGRGVGEGGAEPASGSVWDEMINKYSAVLSRANEGMHRLIVSEVSESLLREYAQSEWLDERRDDQENEDEDEDDSGGMAPTPSLLPALTLLHTHLSHLYPALSSTSSSADARARHRRIAQDLSRFVVTKVVLAGGSRRFTLRGAERFRRDWETGWAPVVRGATMGARGEGAWRFLRDVGRLLSLPSSSSSSSAAETETRTGEGEYTLARAMRVLWEGGEEEWRAMCDALELRSRELTGDRGLAREVVRRRVECMLR